MTRRATPTGERGAIAVTVALLMTVVCLAAAFAIDLGNLAQTHRRAQMAVDDAALSAADLLAQNQSESAAATAAEQYLTENFRYPSGTTVSWTGCPTPPSGFTAPTASENCVTFDATGTEVNVDLPPQLVTYMLAQGGSAKLTGTKVTASATAASSGGSLPCALCVLAPTGKTLWATGSGALDVTGGSIWVNSTNTASSNPAYAASADNGGSVTAPAINIVGTPYTSAGGWSPVPKGGASPIPDPLAYLPTPSPASGTIPSGTYTTTSADNNTQLGNKYGSVTVQNGGTATIQPGDYSTIDTEYGTLTMTAGTYIVDKLFQVANGGTLVEDPGVTLYFTCGSATAYQACTGSGQAGGQLNLEGGSKSTFAPPTSGSYQGLSVFYDRLNDSEIQVGNNAQGLSGTLYAKSSELYLTGGTTTAASLVVVGSVYAPNDAKLNVNYVPSQNVEPPGTSFLCSSSTGNC